MARIYTRSGDDGSTGLGTGERVSKADLRIEAYGTVDELNSHLGRARVQELSPAVETLLAEVQGELFVLGAELAAARSGDRLELRIEQAAVDELEAAIDRFQEELEPLRHFILPGGTAAAAELHVARTVCRRAERGLVRLGAAEEVRPEAIRYLNRLSDLLFVLARYENAKAGVADVPWHPP
ncbi:MAG: cob(I)yrinic acid a,c-diamide adenosyltransferase [Thermoanaerobaculia bacterium]